MPVRNNFSMVSCFFFSREQASSSKKLFFVARHTAVLLLFIVHDVAFLPAIFCCTCVAFLAAAFYCTRCGVSSCCFSLYMMWLFFLLLSVVHGVVFWSAHFALSDSSSLLSLQHRNDLLNFPTIQFYFPKIPIFSISQLRLRRP
eukprot:GHVP01058913.1.p1 GENE.GHVP01058913.1~~GHVP01058913.1.p1  ORF type:complete len:144 (-),score=12.41 GHVP01058913.1:109-540(-)